MNICLLYINQMIKKIILLLVSILYTFSGTIDIFLTNNQASAVSDYSFSILQESEVTIPSGSEIKIIFPIQYQEVSLDGSYNCYVGNWITGQSFPTITCSLSGLTMTIHNCFPNTVISPTNTLYMIVVQSLNNPIYAQDTQVFTSNFETTSSIVLYTCQSSYGFAGIQISEGTMTCSFTSSPTTTSSPASMIVGIIPTSYIPFNTTLTLTLNVFWPSNAEDIDPILEQPVSCLPISNSSNTIQCVYVRTSSSIALTITNLVDAPTSGLIQFSISSIINPPTTEPQGSFSISSKKDGTRSMQRCTGNKITGVTANSLSSVSFTVEDREVNAISKGYLQFTVNTLIASSDSLIINFPIQMDVSTISQILILNGFITDSNPAITGNTVTTHGISATESSIVSLQITNITIPASQSTTNSFAISLSRNSYTLEQLQTTLVFTARRGTISSTLFSTSYQIGVISGYTFSITLSNPINNDSLLILTFPSSFSSSLSSTYCEPLCSISSEVFTFTSLVGQSLTLNVLNVDNPLEVGQISEFNILTQFDPSSERSIVDEISHSLSLTFIARQLETINIVSNSDEVYNYPTTIIFSLVNQNQIPENCYVTIIFPNTIQVQQNAISCLYETQSIFCSFDTSSRTLTMSTISDSFIEESQIGNFSIIGIYNPASTKATESFQFNILNIYGQTIAYLNSGLLYSVGTPTKFSTLSLSTNNTKNSAQTSITVSFSLRMSYLNESFLILTFPEEINVQNIVCSPLSSNLESISCSKSSNIIKVRLVFLNLDTNQVSFLVQAFQNFPSLQSYNVLIELYETSSQAFLICSQYKQLINNELSAILIHSYSWSNPVLQQTTSLTISFTPVSLGFSLLNINLPNDFTISLQSWILPTELQCTLSGSTYTITHQNNDTIVTPIDITLKEITSPSFTPSTQIIIETYSSRGYRMSRDNSVIFQTQCTLPCKTCESSNFSHCLSCYENELLVSGRINFHENVCISNCNNGQYTDNNTNTCENCSTTCELCTDYSTCTACPSGSYLFENTCVLSCPLGYFIYIDRCQKCSSPCLTCDNSLECSSCEDNYFLYNGNCDSTCPSLITFQNVLTWVCDSCPNNCTSCSGNFSSVVCTQCENGFYFDNGGCYEQCRTIATVPSGSQCVECSFTCLTCVDSPQNCLTCDYTSPYPYYHNSRCLSSCPLGFFQSNSTYTCDVCTDPCQTCTSLSINSCLSCLSDYFIIGSSCLSACPSNYYPNIYQCSTCQSPCQECSSETSCLSCLSGYYLYGDDCVTQCPEGMTILNGNECLICDSSCKTCSTSSFCTSCFTSNYLYNGTCSVTCPTGTYKDSSTLTCLSCETPCNSCSSGTYCISCINTALYIQEGACVSECTHPLIGLNSVCTQCSIQCATCATQTDFCIECALNYYYYQQNSSCALTCSSVVYNDGVNNKCVDECPSGMFPDSGNFCTTCPTECDSCVSDTNCTTCNVNYNYYNQFCYETCPDTHPYAIQNTCQLCNTTFCETCQQIHSCSQCTDSYLLILQTYKVCIANCSSSEEYNSTSLACQKITTITTTTTMLLPDYLFLMIGGGLVLIMMVSRIMKQETNIVICLYLIVGFMSTCNIGYVAYYEISQILSNKIIVYPTSYILVAVLGIHAFGCIVNFIGLACTKDYSLVEFFQSYPITGLFLVIFSLIEYRLTWMIHCGLFALNPFLVKLCKSATIKFITFMVCVSVTETVGTLTFGIYSLLISNSIVNRLLLSTPQTKLLSEGLFVETIVLGSILLLLSITMLLLNRSLYERQEVQVYKDHPNENNESLNELNTKLNQKEVLSRRFNDDLISDPSELYDFQISKDKTGYITETILEQKETFTARSEVNKTKSQVIIKSQAINTLSQTNFIHTNQQQSKVIPQKVFDSNIQVDMENILIPQLQEQTEKASGSKEQEQSQLVEDDLGKQRQSVQEISESDQNEGWNKQQQLQILFISNNIEGDRGSVGQSSDKFTYQQQSAFISQIIPNQFANNHLSQLSHEQTTLQKQQGLESQEVEQHKSQFGYSFKNESVCVQENIPEEFRHESQKQSDVYVRYHDHEEGLSESFQSEIPKEFQYNTQQSEINQKIIYSEFESQVSKLQTQKNDHLQEDQLHDSIDFSKLNQSLVKNHKTPQGMLAKLREKRRNVKEEIKENLKNVSEKSREYFQEERKEIVNSSEQVIAYKQQKQKAKTQAFKRKEEVERRRSEYNRGDLGEDAEKFRKKSEESIQTQQEKTPGLQIKDSGRSASKISSQNGHQRNEINENYKHPQQKEYNQCKNVNQIKSHESESFFVRCDDWVDMDNSMPISNNFLHEDRELPNQETHHQLQSSYSQISHTETGQQSKYEKSKVKEEQANEDRQNNRQKSESSYITERQQQLKQQQHYKEEAKDIKQVQEQNSQQKQEEEHSQNIDNQQSKQQQEPEHKQGESQGQKQMHNESLINNSHHTNKFEFEKEEQNGEMISNSKQGSRAVELESVVHDPVLQYKLNKAEKMSEKTIINDKQIQMNDKYSCYQPSEEQQYKSELDDASKFNKNIVTDPHVKEDTVSNPSLLIFDQEQQQIQSSIIYSSDHQSHKLSSNKQKHLTFIEDLQQLDEMVKSPIKKSHKLDSLMEKGNSQDRKPSEYIRQKVLPRRQALDVEQERETGKESSKEGSQRYNFRKKKIQYEECDIIYEQEEVRSNQKSQERQSLDKKPSKLLRGSFKKIGQMIVQDKIK